jgi:hypothetical protein
VGWGEATFNRRGVPIIAVNILAKDCRFFGTLVDEAG